MNFLNLIASANTSGVSNLVGTAYKTFRSVIDIVLPVIIGVVLVFGIVYGIILGIQFAKAEDTEGRDKAKGRLINMIIGVLVAAVIAVIVYAILRSNIIAQLFPSIPDSGAAA